MCIAKSVGLAARNDVADVRIVQVLLNLNSEAWRADNRPPLSVDGQIGPNTIDAIRAFETRAMGLRESDGLVTPGDATMARLLAGLPPGPTKDKLGLVMPRAMPKRIDLYYEPLVKGMTRYGIDTPRQIAHFIAQLAHESGSLLYAEELASGSAYEGRVDLGNTQPGDGPRFKGRGLIQLTGRANYRDYSEFTGIDYVSDPNRIALDPVACVDVACWFWQHNGLPPLAEADDARAVTKRINGGYNGLDDRLEHLARAKALLGL
ncbi:glycoside hydrolase family 19 protein [Roseateles puraquae]|uniref:Chitinase n=1 Tax=Roseateles puraquae TaxID=431059 RepID=A0A254N8D1_9BURK|nr:glycoside hydrolase family 19 protein [Roseateles puraquae]MDG0854291.1 chitinase [Roseateles puraquae]OWR03814.1 chitinase [Roseateles puraquae]